MVETDAGRRVTWAQLNEEVDRVADGLSAIGMVAGYRVAICVGNRLEFVSSYLGALRARLVAVPVNPRAATGEMVRMIADCGARLVFADPTTVTTVRSAVAGLHDALEGADRELRERTVVPRVVVVAASTVPGESSYDELLRNPAQRSPAAADGEALAVLLYTSGTSGRPRAAMLTHRALLANIEQTAAVRPPMLHGDDVVFGVLPLFHVYGLNAVLGQVLRQGATLVLDNSGTAVGTRLAATQAVYANSSDFQFISNVTTPVSQTLDSLNASGYTFVTVGSGTSAGSNPRTFDAPPRAHGPRPKRVSISAIVLEVPSLIVVSAVGRS